MKNTIAMDLHCQVRVDPTAMVRNGFPVCRLTLSFGPVNVVIIYLTPAEAHELIENLRPYAKEKSVK